MSHSSFIHQCPIHGKPTKRHACRQCNAAYMREYLRQRRYREPCRTLWDRAYKRANAHCLPFSIPKNSISVPPTCPALGLKIELLGHRSACSPSLDRIIPSRGYVADNVRVISDRANRLKGNRTLQELRHLAENGTPTHRDKYRMIATYVEREELLAEVRLKATQGGRAGEEWAKIARFLDRVFRKAIISAGRG